MIRRLSAEIRNITGKKMSNSNVSAGVARVANRTGIIVNENSSYATIKAVANWIARYRDV